MAMALMGNFDRFIKIFPKISPKSLAFGKIFYIIRRIGSLAERLNAPVLKTGVGL